MTKREIIQVLLIEDNQADVRLIEEALRESSLIEYKISFAESLKEGLQKLKDNPIEVILIDLGLPDCQGLETFEKLYQEYNNIPIVILSGLRDESVAIEAVQKGAQDYLIKGTFESKLLSLSLHFAVERFRLSKLEEAKDAAVQSAQLKSQFLANMSHEIRTPMYGIIGMIEFLNGTNLTEEQKEYVQTIYLSSKILLKLLDNILDFSMIETSKIPLIKENFNVISLIHEVIEEVKKEAERKNVTINYNILGFIPESLFGDIKRIKQIFSNIIGNAVKFTDKGQIDISLKAIQQQEESKALIQLIVKDTGIGISQQEQSQLFDPFMHYGESVKRRHSGTGLGLAISKQLAELMGGTITFVSEKDKGSKFTIEIPFSLETEEKRGLKRKLDRRILVAEDNTVNQKVILLQLKKLGFQADVAENGVETIKKLKEGNYDLILMDCQMPEMDGYTATREIRGIKDDKSNIPIIAMTAHAMHGDEERCLSSGMNDYLSKPIMFSDLKQVLSKYL